MKTENEIEVEIDRLRNKIVEEKEELQRRELQGRVQALAWVLAGENATEINERTAKVIAKIAKELGNAD